MLISWFEVRQELQAMLHQMFRRVISQKRYHFDKGGQEVEMILSDTLSIYEEAVSKAFINSFRNIRKVLTLKHHINLFPFVRIFKFGFQYYGSLS